MSRWTRRQRWAESGFCSTQENAIFAVGQLRSAIATRRDETPTARQFSPAPIVTCLMSQIASILVSEITVNSRLRSASDDKVAALAGSMREIGLQVPIDVYCNECGSLALVAGLHRLFAARKLGWDQIRARVLTLDHVDRQLWEIDEYLMRAELSLMERADHHAKRKRLLEARGAVQVHGGDR